MQRLITIILALLVPTLLFAGGGQETSSSRDRTREAPRLDAAAPNPVADISGYTIRTAAHWPGPEPGSVHGDAILSAWDDVMTEFDVRRAWIETPNPSTTLEKLTATVLLGEPFADIIWVDGASAIPVLADNNLILPLDDYIDFSDPRWPANAQTVTLYKGKHYGVIPWILAPGSGLWYNRTLFQREGLPDPQELVRAGEWTWDRYLDIARRTTQDTDGDGEIDQWGIAIGYEIEYPLIASNGARVVRRTEGNRYRFSLDEDAAIEALEFISEIYRSNVVSYQGESLFISGRAAMYGGELFQGNNMLINMNDDYGWVYYPSGPAVSEPQVAAGPGVIIVFPANVNYPPDRLGQIVTRTTPFAEMRDVQREFIEAQVRTDADIDMIWEMIDHTTFALGTDSFPGLRRNVGEIFREIRNGTSPATAVAHWLSSGQQIIDSVFR